MGKNKKIKEIELKSMKNHSVLSVSRHFPQNLGVTSKSLPREQKIGNG